jgi:adenine-specific DNA-methyltransferase
LSDFQTEIGTLRGIQQSFMTPPLASPALPMEPKGSVYTKGWVVELLLDLAGYDPKINLVDRVAVEPSTGEGAFLAPMIERLLDSCERLGRPASDCRDSLIAFELDDLSSKQARDYAASVLVNRGVHPSVARSLAQTWVRTGDYLLESIAIKADFVIGNPPYVRLEDIPEGTAQLYRDTYATMRGRADLYIAFFEAALHQLKSQGTCAFICADRWMRNQYGAELRKLITSSFAVEVIIEMHQADAFDDEVDAYPAITVIRRCKQGPTIVASAGPDVQTVPTSKLADALRTGRAVNIQGFPKGLQAASVDTWFSGTDPWPCTSPEQLALLRRLEVEFTALEANARVGIGVATGNDSIFITKDSELVEPTRLLKLALAKDIRNGSLIWSGHYLVDPWNHGGLVKIGSYPKLDAYFERHREVLKSRHTAIKSTVGWYKTIDRVSHNLTAKRKLYIADIKERLNPVLDNGETYPHHNLYFIESDVWNLEVLGGLLISAVGQFFIESYGVRMRGGYLRFQAQYLRRIRVPEPQAISTTDAMALTKAFRERDIQLATDVALDIYRISAGEKEIVLGYR